MINKTTLKIGRAIGSADAVLHNTPVTVFVGPNNSGKSSALREILFYCTEGKAGDSFKIISKVEFSPCPENAVAKEIESITLVPLASDAIGADEVLVGSAHGRQRPKRDTLIRLLLEPNINPVAFCYYYARHKTLFLGGPNRVNLLEEKAAGDLQRSPDSVLESLFRDDVKRTEVRRIVHEAIGMYFVVDPTRLGHLRVRLSKRPPNSALEERGIHDEAVAFHHAAIDIADASDGVKAFAGIIAEVIAGDPKVILIDEPEAFLHPSLSSKLGLEICRAAKIANKRIFVSTHSNSFLMGCIQSGIPVDIVRLTHGNGVGTARILPNAEILELMRHPLLRSTGLLSGLFFESVIVTESDADRAFYQEVNERLLQFKPEWGIPNCLFINGQNKQTIQTLVRPLRKLGIPAAGIVDIDAIKEGGQSWSALLDSLSIPAALHGGLATMRGTILKAFEATGKDMKREGGIEVLAPPEREATQALFRQLAEYGLFVVPSGELESWLKDLKVPGHGPQWLIGMFERIGVDPMAAGYLKPSNDDVWSFMGSIKAWLLDPKRKGIPT